MCRFRLLCEFGRNRSFLAFSIAAHGVGVGLHGDQIDYASKVAFAADGQEHRHHLSSKGIPQGFERTIFVGTIAIHAIHHDDSRHIHLSRVVPNTARHGFNATDAIDYHQRRLGRDQRSLGLVQKHVETRGVDQVDLALVPLTVRGGEGNRHLPRDLFLVPGGNCRSVVHAPEPRS